MSPRSVLAWSARAVAWTGAAAVTVLCVAGWFRHRPRRVPGIGGYRCDRCGLSGASLDDLDDPTVGQGYATPGPRPEFVRDERYT